MDDERRPIPPDEHGRTHEERTRQADRKIARLAAKELADYTGMSARDAWSAFQRFRALKRSGESDTDILRRLNP